MNINPKTEFKKKKKLDFGAQIYLRDIGLNRSKYIQYKKS